MYVCTCDKLYPDLCSCYFGNDDNDTDVVVFPLFHITDSQHSSLHSLRELLLYWDQLEASEPVITQKFHKRLAVTGKDVQPRIHAQSMNISVNFTIPVPITICN